MSDLSLPEPVGYHAQPLDIQHDTDPAHEEHARRTPHFGHAALFFGIIIVSIILCLFAVVFYFVTKHPHTPLTIENLAHPSMYAQLVAYALTFVVAFPVFPLIWQKSFLDGIHWTFRAVVLHWWKLLLFGIALSILAQLAEHLPFIKVPQDPEVLKLMNTQLSAWITAFSAAIVAPIVEEIAFRGFLLPALAIAYDWVCLDKTPAALMRWQQTTSLSSSAYIFSAVVTSVAFAAIHGAQLHWPIGVLGILFGVSLVLSAVRIHYKSVAASALVHMTYNGALFAVMIVVTGGFRHLDRLTK